MIGFPTEGAIRFLASRYPQESLKKPSLFHSMRVASYLFLHGYSEEICIAGLLHDAIEDTTITEDEITKLYGKHTAEIVVANSKDTSLPKEEILQDIVTRCADHSEDALIVKSADVLDNFAFYTLCGHQGVNMESEILRCKKLARMILDTRKPQHTDPIFSSLEHISI